MGSKVKITKRDIKEDKFTTSMLLTKNWLEERWQVVAIVAAIIIVVIIGAIYMVNMNKAKEKEGADAFLMAISKMRQLNYQEAILDLNGIIDNYGGKIAAQAQFYVANCHYESRNFDEAMASYEKYINKYHQDKLITASAYAGIAACLENKQEYASAGDNYIKAVNYFPESSNVADYYLGAVRSYVLANDNGKADLAYNELKEKFPNTESYNTATRLIMSLRIK